MNIIFVGISIWLISISALMSQEPSISLQKASTLLDQINTKKSQRPGWDEPSTAIESGRTGLEKLPEFVELEQITRTAWPQLIANIQTVAPSRMSKTVLFLAFQSLPTDDYLQFLDQAVGLAENKIIDKQLLDWALLPWNKNVRGVLAYNYEKPVVKDILQRVKVLYADDPNMVGLYSGVLSGTAKKEMEEYYNEVPTDSRPVPAQQSLSTNSVTPTNTVSTFEKITALPTVMQAPPFSHRPLAWVVVVAIVLIIGGIFARGKI